MAPKNVLKKAKVANVPDILEPEEYILLDPMYQTIMNNPPAKTQPVTAKKKVVVKKATTNHSSK